MINNLKNEVFLFTPNSNGPKYNTLKCFHAFLGHVREVRPFRYAYSSEKPNSIPGATVLESICIERASCIPIHGKQIYSKDILAQIDNPFIHELLRYSGDLSTIPDFNKDQEHSKLAELIRVIITTTPYILLESPETYLTQKALNLVMKALHFEIKNSKAKGIKKQILVYTDDSQIWSFLATQIIARDKIGIFYICDATCEYSPDKSQNFAEHKEYLKKMA